MCVYVYIYIYGNVCVCAHLAQEDVVGTAPKHRVDFGALLVESKHGNLRLANEIGEL